MNSNKNAQYWITQLKLQSHPEGGFFKETYRSIESIWATALPDRYADSRSFSTAIYFLLRSEDKSLFHRIKSDEIWHFHAGSALTIYVLNKDGLSEQKLGPEPENGDSLQVVIPAGSWFGAIVNKPDSFTLAGCTVAPGFDFDDFELANSEKLLKEFPDHSQIIKKLTK
ncbi:MAG: cupin domain-containing protein [Cyclobacteriaceae bacterium]|nr:cupin domain-containing protein [Cyclobacteriaceae bacterium]